MQRLLRFFGRFRLATPPSSTVSGETTLKNAAFLNIESVREVPNQPFVRERREPSVRATVISATAAAVAAAAAVAVAMPEVERRADPVPSIQLTPFLPFPAFIRKMVSQPIESDRT